MRPMLATPTDRVPTGGEWRHEVKWDGMRVLVDVRDSVVRVSSRTERDVTVAFPELAGLGALFPDMMLDGEVVVLTDGLPSFGALAERFHVTDATRAARLASTAPATLMTFDLLRLYGVDLTGRTWSERRATLERLDLAGPHVKVPPTFTDGEVLLAATLDQGLEGVVSKRVASTYFPGRRSADWRKRPHRTTRSVVIGGWRPEVDRRDRLGAVLVGVPVSGGLQYLGRVGSGLVGRAGTSLSSELASLRADHCPFATQVPTLDSTGATWVQPRLVIDVTSLGLSSGGRVRHPAYERRRPDLEPTDLAGAHA